MTTRLTTIIVLLSLWLIAAAGFAQGTSITESDFRNAVFVVVKGDVGSTFSADVLPGDRLLAINDQPVHDPKDVPAIVENAKGKPLNLSLERASDGTLHALTVLVTPGGSGKIGLGFSKPLERILFDKGGKQVVLASSGDFIVQHPHAADARIDLSAYQVASGTKVLALAKMKAPYSEVYLMDGPHKGEIWFAYPESVQPKLMGRGISWFFYLAALGAFWMLVNQASRRRITLPSTIMSLGLIARLVGDIVPSPDGFELAFKASLDAASIVCLLITFGILMKWTADDRRDGIAPSQSGAGGVFYGVLSFIILPLLLVYGFIAGMFRNFGQPSQLPEFAASEISNCFADKIKARNARVKDQARHMELQPFGAKYRGYELRWKIHKRLLHVIGALPTQLDEIMKQALTMGGDARYKLSGKIAYFGCWNGFVIKQDGSTQVLWDDEKALDVVSEILGEFADAVDDALDEAEDDQKGKGLIMGSGSADEDCDGDGGDSFEEWMEDPDWFPASELRARAKGGGVDAVLAAWLSEVCSERDFAMSTFGLLISLEKGEALSEAESQGGGIVAIIWHGYPSLLHSLRPRLSELGCHIVYNDTSSNKLFVYKSADQYSCLEAQEHVAHLSAKSVIRKLREWDETYNLSVKVCGMGIDWVDAETTPPTDTRDLAVDINRFCPDILEHEVHPVDVLTEELKDGRIHLWWD